MQERVRRTCHCIDIDSANTVTAGTTVRGHCHRAAAASGSTQAGAAALGRDKSLAGSARRPGRPPTPSHMRRVNRGSTSAPSDNYGASTATPERVDALLAGDAVLHEEGEAGPNLDIVLVLTQ